MASSSSSSVNVVVYLRVSTTQQAEEDKVSLAEQEIECRRYAERQGWTILQVYQDAGYSGASKNRPALRDMLRDVEKGNVDVILAWDEDRLARGTSHALIQDAIEGTRTTIHTRNGRVDPLLFAIKAAVGKQELEDKRKRSQLGARGRARKGKLQGIPKYGYQSDEDGFPVVAEVEAGVVRRIFTTYLQGATCTEIALELEREGGPPGMGERGTTSASGTCWSM